MRMSHEKIYAISDLHVDQVENMKWVEQLSNDKYLNDTIIIAGERFIFSDRVIFVNSR